MADATCSNSGCSKPEKARGWCAMHYRRWKKGRDMDAPMNPTYIRQPRIMNCTDCDADFETTGHNSKRCEGCKPAYQNAQNKKYRDKNKERLAAQTRARINADPEKHKADVKRRREARGDAYREYHRKWRQDNRPKLSLQRRCREFGITEEDILGMFYGQEAKCAICRDELTFEGRWDVDHCHTTGIIRGILCMRCNRGMGMFRDNPDLCEMAAIYLRTSTKYQSLASGE